MSTPWLLEQRLSKPPILFKLPHLIFSHSNRKWTATATPRLSQPQGRSLLLPSQPLTLRSSPFVYLTLHQEQAYLCILMTTYFGVGGKTIRLNSRPSPAASGFRSCWPPWPQGPVLLWHKVQGSPVTLVIRLTHRNLYTDSHRNRVQVHPATTKLWVPD